MRHFVFCFLCLSILFLVFCFLFERPQCGVHTVPLRSPVPISASWAGHGLEAWGTNKNKFIVAQARDRRPGTALATEYLSTHPIIVFLMFDIHSIKAKAKSKNKNFVFG